MKRRLTRYALATLACLLAGAFSASTAAAQRLEPGQIVGGSTNDENAAVFEFRARTAGILTVIVRSADETDLVLRVTDADGQPLPNGDSDQDLGGNSGAEQFAVTIPRAGNYMVRVETYGWGKSTFRLGSSWISFPDLEVPPDPDGSPSTAIQLAVEQQSVNSSIDGSSGDYWDWYVLTARQSGTLTVLTRAEEGDLVLEAFAEDEYTEPMESSDQDLQGASGNEALTLSVNKGERIYFKVRAFSEGSSVQYRLQVGFIPD